MHPTQMAFNRCRNFEASVMKHPGQEFRMDGFAAVGAGTLDCSNGKFGAF